MHWLPAALTAALIASGCADQTVSTTGQVSADEGTVRTENDQGDDSNDAGCPGAPDHDNDFPVIPNLPETPTFSVSTIPDSGDVNPYGVAFVPNDFPSDGLLRPDDIVVSNFNNSGNVQGTGSSIVTIHPDGTQSLFFQGEPGLGLSTALVVLKSGFVIVGNVPSTDGSGMCVQENGVFTNVGQGQLTILDRFGNVAGTLQSKDFLNGPWDMTVLDNGDEASLFVSNVLLGTVTRLDIEIGRDGVVVKDQTVIASGYQFRCDPAAFVVGPTGLALDTNSGVLYVASTGDNKIFAIPNAVDRTCNAGMGNVFIDDPNHLRGPLGLALAPNGNLLSAQGDAVNPDPNHPSEIVEFDPKGNFVAQFSIDSAPGSAFGLAIRPLEDGFVFAAVDDGMNVLDVWEVP